jgi:hypothetical protein
MSVEEEFNRANDRVSREAYESTKAEFDEIANKRSRDLKAQIAKREAER